LACCSRPKNLFGLLQQAKNLWSLTPTWDYPLQVPQGDTLESEDAWRGERWSNAPVITRIRSNDSFRIVQVDNLFG
jgi:hypothetical protein